MIDGRMTECMKSLFCQIVRMVISLASLIWNALSNNQDDNQLSQP
jgi:hypothetical protein